MPFVHNSARGPLKYTDQCSKTAPPHISVGYFSRQSTGQRLQVKSFDRATVLLGLHDALASRTEVIHLDSHTTLSQSHQTSFGTNGSNVGTGKIIFLVDKLIQVHIVTERHLRCVQREDLLLGVLCIDRSMGGFL